MAQRWQCQVCGYVYRGAAPPRTCPSCGAPFTAFEPYSADPAARFADVRVVHERPAGYRYVIIGNSAAGRSAARAIRALDQDGSVTIISEEKSDFYYRPLLPDFIGGLPREDLFAAGSAYSKKGIGILLGERADRIDVAAKEVLRASGKRVPFDALLLATGSAPVQVPWPGSEAEGIAYFRTFEDAERIARHAKGGKRAVVVGGGLLGLEFVRAFLAARLKVTHLVRESRVGFPTLDDRLAPIIESALSDLGVELRLEEEVERFESADGRVCAVMTSKGRRIECDLVGIAVGVRPRVELAKDAGLEVDRGVLVDRRMRTSAPDVYAAGDVAQAYDRIFGQPRVNTSWRNSQEQGELAGIVMAGGDAEYAGAVPANYQLAAGLPFCALGMANPPEPEGYEIELVVDERARTARKVVRKAGAVVGASLIGDLSDAGQLEQSIRGQQPAAAEREAAISMGDTRGPEPQPEAESGMHKITKAHLEEAFAGESQAHMKYLNFAEKATEEGKENVARLFRAASYSEQVHATAHLTVLEGIGTTSENLAAAIGGEGFEIAEMYPAYMAVAEQQAEEDAKVSFHHALEAEKVHHDLYERAKQAVDGGQDAEIAELWVCSSCGFTMEGDPPARCPVCTAPKKFFVQF
jgi:nitrite reductase (NADH) large subunit